MVGTPPNIIANGALEAAGIADKFGFFEFAWIGIPVTVAGIIYMMFLGKYLLPKAELDADQEIEQEVEANETSASKQISLRRYPVARSFDYGYRHQGRFFGNGSYYRRNRLRIDWLFD